MGKFLKQYDDQITGCLSARLSNQLRDQLKGKLWEVLRNDIKEQLLYQFWDQVCVKLWQQSQD